jgi:hypothetical protein
MKKLMIVLILGLAANIASAKESYFKPQDDDRIIQPHRPATSCTNERAIMMNAFGEEKALGQDRESGEISDVEFKTKIAAQEAIAKEAQDNSIQLHCN